MSDCIIGLPECKYNDMCFKICATCVRQQFEYELKSIESKAYNRGREYAIDKFVEKYKEFKLIPCTFLQCKKGDCIDCFSTWLKEQNNE